MRQLRRMQWGALALVVAGVVTAGGLRAAPAGVGSVTFLQGEAQRQGQGGGAWVALAKGGELQEGDTIKTQAGARLEAKLKDGSLLRLSEGSELTLRQVKVNGSGGATKKTISAKLVVGKVWAAVTKLFGDESSFEVTTANAVAGVRGTRFSASQDAAGTVVKVYDGKVLISNQPIYAIKGHTKGKRVQVAGPQEISKKQWEEMLASAMQMVRVAADGKMTQPEGFVLASAQDDAWEAWNRERDQAAGLDHP